MLSNFSKVYLAWKTLRSTNGVVAFIYIYIYIPVFFLELVCNMYLKVWKCLKIVCVRCMYRGHVALRLVTRWGRGKMAAILQRPLTNAFYWNCFALIQHHSDVIMSFMASQFHGVLTVCSTVSSDEDQRKHQRSALLALCEGNPPVTLKKGQ